MRPGESFLTVNQGLLRIAEAPQHPGRKDVAANPGVMDHPGRRGGWHILAGHPLLQVDERRAKLTEKKAPPSQSRMRFESERLVLVAFGQRQESLAKPLGRLVRCPHHIKQPQPGEHRQELGGVFDLLTQRIRPAIGLFHLRGSLALGSHERATQRHMHV